MRGPDDEVRIADRRIRTTSEDRLRRFVVHWRFGLLVWVGLFSVMSAWSISVPVSSAPDETGHVIKAAATVRGDFTGSPSKLAGNRDFRLPGNVGDVGGSLTCFVGGQEPSAACAPPLESRSRSIGSYASGAGAYNPTYYALVGWPSLIWNGTAMVLAMRLMSALLSSVLWAVAIVGLSARSLGRRIFLLVALTPMALYLGGVVNPNGTEIAATAALAGLLWNAVNDDRPRGALLPIALAIVGALLLNLRSISPLFALLDIVFIVAIAGLRKSSVALVQRRYLGTAIALVIAGLGAATWTLAVGLGAGYIPSAITDRPGPIKAFVHTLTTLDDQFREMVGILGWFDAPLPVVVYLVWFGATIAVIAIALLHARPRSAVIVIGAVLTTVLIPAVLQAATAEKFGYIWQGRYTLPLFVLLLAVSALVVPETVWSALRTWPMRALSIVILVLQLWSFLNVIKRYAVGGGGSWSQFWTAPEWTPPGGIPLSVGLFTLGTALSLAAVIVSRRSRNYAAANECESRIEPA